MGVRSGGVLHTCVYDIIGNSQGFPQWGLPFAIEIIIFNMCTCVEHHHHPTSNHPHPESWGEAQITKIQQVLN